MHILPIVSFVVALVSSVAGQESVGIFSDPAHPGKCVLGDVILSPGQEATLKGQCEIFMCGNAEGWATIQGCGVMSVQGCTMGDSLYPEESYPKCFLTEQFSAVYRCSQTTNDLVITNHPSAVLRSTL
ncbi:uncharacterized protein LOC142234579 [Haematobia irritans]|uniref:uncharacterized protein LOC142234579 n=1 Tax=Haematobia irritans TaxID=7368 RepID=UPI003F503A39